ncbi:hypothetical protein C8Q78DRAFT_414390 [Trametes maxima]|nr:hypothetical protein C8Q78DRAFT_414390 [Trametes maxima]
MGGFLPAKRGCVCVCVCVVCDAVGWAGLSPCWCCALPAHGSTAGLGMSCNWFCDALTHAGSSDGANQQRTM